MLKCNIKQGKTIFMNKYLWVLTKKNIYSLKNNVEGNKDDSYLADLKPIRAPKA